VLGGFLERARAIEALLRQPDVGFLLVLAPELPAVEEALFFVERLRTAGLNLDAFVANRVLPTSALVAPDEIRAHLEAHFAGHPTADGQGGQLGWASWPPADQEAAARALAGAADHLTRLGQSQRRELERLSTRAPGVPVLEVPLLAHDPASAAALRTIGDRLGHGAPPHGAPPPHSDRSHTSSARLARVGGRD
jgi:anion-transporting  ArsA/GET3 family ATPase